MVSIFSSHFFNWTLQLKDSSHEIYWLDVLDMETKVQKLNFVHQTTNWKNRINYPGRYRIKKNCNWLHSILKKINQRKLTDTFELLMDEVQPDVVHSFEMNSASIPLLKLMNEKYRNVKWIYSAWGNDYFYQKQPNHHSKMKQVFSRVDYLFTDCYRDSLVAKSLGFEGEYLGKFPGGGGYDLNAIPSRINFDKRKTILVKGYQKKFGRCIKVLEALAGLKEVHLNYRVVVFGSDKEVFEYIEKKKFPGQIEVKGRISRNEVLSLMGESLIYIGNSISDGMPNSLLEAIIMGAFPIHSNPGKATEEILIDGKNGLIIKDPENEKEISLLVHRAINNFDLLKEGVSYNDRHIKPELDRNKITNKVVTKYELVEKTIRSASVSS